MRAFWAILVNDCYRLARHRYRMLMYLIMTAGAIIAAVFFNYQVTTVAKIAVVSDAEAPVLSTSFDVTLLDETPPMSELVAGRYDAVVVFSGSDYQITSIRNAAFVSLIESVLADPTAAGGELLDARGSGSNIFGFLLMFVLMQGVVMLFLFAEDLERQQIRRIVTAPVSFSAYIAAHGLLTFASLLVPVMLLLTVVRLLGFDMGLGLGEYLLLVSLLSGFSTSYGILFIAFIKDGDSANMVGSAIAVITSIVAGSFFAFTGDNYILEKLVTALPQKALLDLAAALESGAGFAEYAVPCLYVLALTICFLAGAAWKLRRDYIKN